MDKIKDNSSKEIKIENVKFYQRSQIKKLKFSKDSLFVIIPSKIKYKLGINTINDMEYRLIIQKKTHINPTKCKNKEENKIGKIVI